MSVPSETQRLSASRIITLILSIIFLGHFIAAVICYFQPKVYESTGVLTEWATPGQSTLVADAHAAKIVSKLELHLRWRIPFDDAVDRLKEIVTIETTHAGTVIRAQYTSGQDARMITESLMKSFPGFERERQWAQFEGLGDRYTENEAKTLYIVNQLRMVTLETLEESGDLVPGSLITAETVARLENENLSRQFKAYQKAAQPIGRFAPPDGNISVPPPIAAEPFEPMSAISPDIEAYILTGRVGGMIAAALAFIIILHRKPSLLQVPRQNRTPTPAWAEIREETGSDHPTW